MNRPTSKRGYPLCRAVGCDIEIHPLRKYCEVHDWHLEMWIKKSRAALEKFKARMNTVDHLIAALRICRSRLAEVEGMTKARVEIALADEAIAKAEKESV